MTHSTDDEWPVYALGPKEHIHAIGVIVTNWTKVESAYQVFIQLVIPNMRVAIRAWELLGNESRWQLIRDELPHAIALTPEERDLLDHFLKAAAICKENRNLVAHADYEASHMADAIKANKGRTKDFQNLRIFSFKLDALREMADAVAITANLGFNLWGSISMRLHKTAFPSDALPPFPLPPKPPLPRKWDQHTLEEPPAYQRPHESSPE